MTSDDKKPPKRSRKTPVAGTPTSGDPPSRPTPKPRRSRRTPVSTAVATDAPRDPADAAPIAHDDGAGVAANDTPGDRTPGEDARDVATDIAPDLAEAKRAADDASGEATREGAELRAGDARDDEADVRRERDVATDVRDDGARGVATDVRDDGARDVATAIAPGLGDATRGADDAAGDVNGDRRDGGGPLPLDGADEVASGAEGAGAADRAAADAAFGADPAAAPDVAAAGGAEAAGADDVPSHAEAAGAADRVAADAAAPTPAGAPGPARAYDDPELAAMPETERVGDISSLLPQPGSSGQLPTMAALPDPAAAAFEAARIAEKIVGGNIETASGAAIVAAAAAGAAIEAARMRALAGEPASEPPNDASAGSGTATGATSAMGPGSATAAAAAANAAEGAGVDPVTTVRMQRERVLRALAADVAATATTTVAAEQQAAAAAAAATAAGGAAGMEGRARTPSGAPPYPRAQTHPGVDDGIDELDPVQIAAAAIQRLRQRASTDFAELRGHYQRHDLVVLVLAFVIIVIAGRVHARLVTPPTKQFSVRGLVFQQSTTWLEAEELPPAPPRIVRDPSGQPPKKGTAYHVAYTSSLDPNARLEVFIDKKPAWSNIVTGLELDRRTRYGELYTLDGSRIESVEDQDWLRTEYRYAHVVEKGDAPRVDRAIEYATIDREQIYVVTMFGTPAQLDRMESVIAPTLRVPTRSGMPLVPQTRSLGQRTYPNQVSRAFDSTVMVVVADLVDGRLKARGGGSGVIVGSDGSVLTNYHVIHDKDGKLHDVFVIGRFSTLDRAPQLECAGRPSRSKLQRELDLALIKCDLDLDGRTWQPSMGRIWPTLEEARSSDIKMGQRVWVLGYPDAGGGGLTLSEGAVEGWTGQDGTQGRDFIKTDASITHGNSGGPVVDDAGRLIGIAAASRTRITAAGSTVEVAQVGLVRPLPMATDLLAIAAAGWTPREGHTDVELQPSAVEAPSEGVRIATRVLDAANEAPIRDALVLVLRPNVKASAVDVNRLDDQTLAWGRSNTQGEVQLKQPVPAPGTYTVMVIAHGYEPLIGEGALKLRADTPAAYDPWGNIKLLAR